MRKSFKAHLFVRIVLITAIIIGANRYLAQYFLTDQLRDQVHHDMGLALRSCVNNFNDHARFVSCFKDLEKGSLISNVADFYELCQKPKPSAAASVPPFEACSRGWAADFWRADRYTTHDQIDFSSGTVSDLGLWFAVRFAGKSDGPEVWIHQKDADRMVIQMWNLRDQNLYRVLPVVIILLLLMTLYVTRVLMRPIVSIEESVSKLDASNLDQSTTLQAPFGEFEKLVNVFEDLRIRLNDSFKKARRFASDASHELRTPLTILRGTSEQLIDDFPLGSDAQVRIRSMSDEVERLIEITEKLLLLSRADANSLLQELSDVNLSELMSQLIQDAHSFQPSLKITSQIQPDVIWRCDKTLVRQLIHNLYTNAVNYNQPKGWIHIALKAANGSFELKIENPTVAIPLNLVEHAFDRFYRGDASHARQIDGLGLGLSICLEIAKLHQGSLALTATQQGTVIATLAGPLQHSH